MVEVGDALELYHCTGLHIPQRHFTSTINLLSLNCLRLSEIFLYFIRNVRTRKRTHVKTLHRTRVMKDS